MRHNPVDAPQLASSTILLKIVKNVLHGKSIVTKSLEGVCRHLAHVLSKSLLGFTLVDGLGRPAVHLAAIVELDPVHLSSLIHATRHPLPPSSPFHIRALVP